MRIACPACNAAYQVPDDQLSEGRVVRCARCGSDWAPIEAVPPTEGEREPPPPPVVESRAQEPVPEPVVEKRRVAVEEEIPIPRPPVLPKPAPKPRGPVLLVLAWVLSVAAVGAGVAGLYVGRERVMQAWPPSIRGYAMVGLAPHPPVASEGRE